MGLVTIPAAGMGFLNHTGSRHGIGEPYRKLADCGVSAAFAAIP